MNNKVKITIIFILIIVLSIGILNKDSIINNNYLTIDENKISIKSTLTHNIKKNDIKVEKIDISVTDDHLRVKTVLKNNSKKDIKGFYVNIEFLDENGKVLTMITEDSKETIYAKKTIELLNNIEEFNDSSKIKDARIAEFEKNGTEAIINEGIHQLTPEES